MDDNPLPTLRRALGISLDAIGHAERTGYPFQNHLAEAKPIIQTAYLANGGFDGDLDTAGRIQKVAADLWAIREELLDTLTDNQDGRFLRLSAEIKVLAHEFLPEDVKPMFVPEVK